MEGKICIVTGSSSGIGKGVATLLAKKGANIVMLSRNNDRGKQTFEEIKLLNKKGKVEWIPTDLSSQKSIRKFVKEFKKKYKKLNVLFNCAGVQVLERKETIDGLEYMFATNYLGHFLLTNLLFEPLKAGSPARVITISGRSHKKTITEGTNEGTIDFNDLQGRKSFSFAKASKQAVLAKILFTYEIARRWEKYHIYSVTLCPGLTKTNLVNNLPWYARIYFYIRCFLAKAQTPEEAAEHLVYLASQKKAENINGKYYEVNWKKNSLEEASSSEESYNAKIANRLWKVSEELIGDSFDY